MNFKKISACVLTLAMILTTSMVSFANEQPKALNLEEPENYLIDLNSQDMSEAKILSYDEMTEVLIKDGYTKEEAIKLLGPELESTDGIKTLNNVSARGFMEFKANSITSKTHKYNVDIYAYCEYTSAGTYGAIKTVKHIRVDAGKRAFEGDIYYNLETPLRIYFSVSGKLYSSGTMNISGGLEIELEEGTTAKFEVSRAGQFADTVSASTYYRRN